MIMAGISQFMLYCKKYIVYNIKQFITTVVFTTVVPQTRKGG